MTARPKSPGPLLAALVLAAMAAAPIPPAGAEPTVGYSFDRLRDSIYAADRGRNAVVLDDRDRITVRPAVGIGQRLRDDAPRAGSYVDPRTGETCSDVGVNKVCRR